MINLLVNIIETVPDIPRYHTAIAEWLFALAFIIYLPKRQNKLYKYLGHGLWFGIILGFQLLAGIMPLAFWIPNMIIAGLIMLLYIKISTIISWTKSIYFMMIAFILAELAASLEWQISYFLQISLLDQAFIISIIVLILIYALIFTMVLFLERRYKSRNFQFDIKHNDVVSVLLIGVTIFSISNISFINIYTPFTGQYPMEILYIRTLVDLAGVILLYSQREHKMVLYSTKEAFTMQILLDKQYDQYQQSIKNAEIVNQRYHDLKHYLHLLRSESEPKKKEEYLNEIEKSINVYEAQYKTGNHVLDILLGQKGQQIIDDQINFTCVADGEQLNFMSTLDILSLFGNAMDNAIENVKQITPSEKRLIKLAIFNQDNLLIIKIDNYYTNTLNRQGGMFVSTKKDQFNHGYGIKSIRNIVEKYGGSLNINTDNNWFTLMMLIPIHGLAEESQV
jgi:hypothetical protein